MQLQNSKQNIFTLLVSILCLLTSLTLIAGEQSNSKKPKLILDADTANEIDDLYAIIYTLRQTKYEVLGLNSAQWFHYYGERESLKASQKINEDLVKMLDRNDLPIPKGSEEAMGKPWGGFTPRDSPAAQFIIANALAMPKDEKLTVLSIGACTNLASAIKLNPEIASKIKAYQMGFRYNRKTKVWNKNDFNVRRDLNAADFLLNQKDLELHLMTSDTSRPFKFDRDDTFKRQETMGKLGQYLTKRWKSRTPSATRWTMWDVAAIIAIVNPELAQEEEVITPPENTQRKVWVYHTINVDKMRAEYWKKATTVPAKK